MRITSGKARGISLNSPRGDTTRPATDAARQAVFSSLGEMVLDAKILDVFAGTGAYALEGLSRGAAGASFVESGREALACLKKNVSTVEKAITLAGGKCACEIFALDVFKSENRLAEKHFDLIFADPPYAMLSDVNALKKIFMFFSARCKNNPLYILEAPADFDLPTEILTPNFEIEEIKRLGKKSKGKPSQIIFRIRANAIAQNENSEKLAQ